MPLPNPSPTPAPTGQPRSWLEGVVICATGEARGHAVWTDEHFIRRVTALGNRAPGGLKARFGHPGPLADPIGTEIGRFHRFRAVHAPEFESVLGYALWLAVADLHLLPTPQNEAAIGHLQHVAEADPDLIGASIEFVPGPPAPADNLLGLPHERLESLVAIALTSDPAATAHAGLFLRG